MIPVCNQMGKQGNRSGVEPASCQSFVTPDFDPGGSAGVPAGFRATGTEAGPTGFLVGRASCPSLSDRQSRVPRGTVPPKKGLLRASALVMTL